MDYKKILLEDHGQPINRQYNFKRITDRNIDELIGLCKGILADKKINIAEARFLQNWLEKHSAAIHDQIVNALYFHIREVLSDGTFDKTEQKELFQILTEFTGESSVDFPYDNSSLLPLDRPIPRKVFFNKMNYCFTGKFAFGTRKMCEEQTLLKGAASTSKNVTKKTNYLVVGTFCSKDWLHTSYGRKIKRALEYRDLLKTGIKIVHEDLWAKSLSYKDKTEILQKLDELQRPAGIEIREPKEPLLVEKFWEVKERFEKRGWHLVFTGRFFALTVSNNVCAGAQENIRIVDICSFILENGPEKGKKIWETKTFWGGSRDTSENFEDIWHLFLQYESKYDPKRLIWSNIDDEHVAMRRIRIEDEAIAMIKNILDKKTEFEVTIVKNHLDIFLPGKKKRFCGLYLNNKTKKNIKIFHKSGKEKIYKFLDPKEIENHQSAIRISFQQYLLSK